jgi:hypothetical protein
MHSPLKLSLLSVCLLSAINSGDANAIWREVPASWLTHTPDGMLVSLRHGGVLRLQDKNKNTCPLSSYSYYESAGGGLLATTDLSIDSSHCVAFSVGNDLSARHAYLAGSTDALATLKLAYWKDINQRVLDAAWSPLQSEHKQKLTNNRQNKFTVTGAGTSKLKAADGPYLLRAWLENKGRRRIVNEVAMLRLGENSDAISLQTLEADEAYQTQGCKNNMLEAIPSVLSAETPTAEPFTIETPASVYASLSKRRPALWQSDYWHQRAIDGSDHADQVNGLYRDWALRLAKGESADTAPGNATISRSSKLSSDLHMQKRSRYRNISMESDISSLWLPLNASLQQEFTLPRRAFDADTIKQESLPITFDFLRIGTKSKVFASLDQTATVSDFRLLVSLEKMPVKPIHFTISRGAAQKIIILLPELVTAALSTMSRDELINAYAGNSPSAAIATLSLPFTMQGEGALKFEQTSGDDIAVWVNVQQRLGRARPIDLELMQFLIKPLSLNMRLNLLNAAAVPASKQEIEIKAMLLPFIQWMINEKPKYQYQAPDQEQLKSLMKAIPENHMLEWGAALSLILESDQSAERQGALSTDSESVDDEIGKVAIAPLRAKSRALVMQDGKRTARTYYGSDVNNPGQWKLVKGMQYVLHTRWHEQAIPIANLLLKSSSHEQSIPFALHRVNKAVDAIEHKLVSNDASIPFVWMGDTGSVEFKPETGSALISLDVVGVNTASEVVVQPTGIHKKQRYYDISDCRLDLEVARVEPQFVQAKTVPLASGQADFRKIAVMPINSDTLNHPVTEGNSKLTQPSKISEFGEHLTKVSWQWIEPTQSSGCRYVSGAAHLSINLKGKRFDLSTRDIPLEIYLESPRQLRITRIVSNEAHSEISTLMIAGLHRFYPSGNADEELLRIEKMVTPLVNSLPATPDLNEAKVPAALDNKSVNKMASSSRASLYSPANDNWFAEEVSAQLGTWSLGANIESNTSNEDASASNISSRLESFATWRYHTDQSPFWWRTDAALRSHGIGPAFGLTQYMDYEPHLSPWRSSMQLSYWQQNTSAINVQSINTSAEISHQTNIDSYHRFEPYLRAFVRDSTHVQSSDDFKRIDEVVSTAYKQSHKNGWQLGARYFQRTFVDAEWALEPWIRGNPLGDSGLVDHWGLRARASTFYRGAVVEASLEHRSYQTDSGRNNPVQRTQFSLNADGFVSKSNASWWHWFVQADYEFKKRSTGFQFGLRYDLHGAHQFNDFRPREISYRDLYSRFLNNDSILIQE